MFATEGIYINRCYGRLLSFDFILHQKLPGTKRYVIKNNLKGNLKTESIQLFISSNYPLIFFTAAILNQKIITKIY